MRRRRARLNSRNFWQLPSPCNIPAMFTAGTGHPNWHVQPDSAMLGRSGKPSPKAKGASGLGSGNLCRFDLAQCQHPVSHCATLHSNGFTILQKVPACFWRMEGLLRSKHCLLFTEAGTVLGPLPSCSHTYRHLYDWFKQSKLNKVTSDNNHLVRSRYAGSFDD